MIFRKLYCLFCFFWKSGSKLTQTDIRNSSIGFKTALFLTPLALSPLTISLVLPINSAYFTGSVYTILFLDGGNTETFT